MSDDIKFPNIRVQLTGQDCNVFFIIGAVTQALKRAGHHVAADAYADEVMDAESYDEALRITMRTVQVN